MTVEGGGDLRDRSVPQLLRQLSQETTQLVRQEIELAKAEMTEKGRKASVGAGMFGGAGVAGLLALGALTACAIAALDLAVATWLAALIPALLWSAAAGLLALRGRARVRQATPAAPEQTVETIKEDVEWAKSQTRSVRR
ncbi:MAG: phage holin family protein [Thermoleophilaceae bacterium]|nr:phage holin family protein [Thermoleophilaceae bacterium]